MSEKEDDPVDLKLAALSSTIKRKLNDPDERDEILFEIEQVARKFFRAKKTREETVVPVPACEVVVRPPPPLQPQPQMQEQGGIIEMPVGAQYSPDNVQIEYVRDPTSGATYMKF